MSRSGYSDDIESWDLIRWRGAVTSAIKGARGQRLLRELAAALDAMPVRELAAGEFQAEGTYCALGVVGAMRGMDLSHLDPEDTHLVAQAFGVANAMAAEIMFVNDEYTWGCWERPKIKNKEELDRFDQRERERRWLRVRAWVTQHIAKEAP